MSILTFSNTYRTRLLHFRKWLFRKPAPRRKAILVPKVANSGKALKTRSKFSHLTKLTKGRRLAMSPERNRTPPVLSRSHWPQKKFESYMLKNHSQIHKLPRPSMQIFLSKTLSTHLRHLRSGSRSRRPTRRRQTPCTKRRPFPKSKSEWPRPFKTLKSTRPPTISQTYPIPSLSICSFRVKSYANSPTLTTFSTVSLRSEMKLTNWCPQDAQTATGHNQMIYFWRGPFV
jgi:hypothetical protein